MNSKMKTNKIILLFLIALFFLGVLVYISKKNIINPNKTVIQEVAQNPTQDNPPAAQTIEVIAENGTFTPSKFYSPLSQKIIINVTAVDQDYRFKVPGYDRLTTTFYKGSTTSFTIDLLGVGTYPFTCGSNCNGTIVIEQSADSDED